MFLGAEKQNKYFRPVFYRMAMRSSFTKLSVFLVWSFLLIYGTYFYAGEKTYVTKNVAPAEHYVSKPMVSFKLVQVCWLNCKVHTNVRFILKH